MRETVRSSSLSTVSALHAQEKDARIAASKSFIFFGKTLQPTVKSSADTSQSQPSAFLQSGILANDFIVQNTNAFLIECVICLFTKDPSEQSHSLNEPTKEVGSLFKFSSGMRDLTNLIITDSLTQLKCSLKPGEKLIVRLDFIPPINMALYENNVVNGIVRMMLKGSSRKFTVNLVGFLCESTMNLNAIKSDSFQDVYLEKLLDHRNIKQLKFNMQLSKLESSSSSTRGAKVFRKSLKLMNCQSKSFSNSNRCICFPVLYDNKYNSEIVSLTEGRDKYFDVDINGIDKFQILFRLNFDAAFQQIRLSEEDGSDEITWFEIHKANEAYDMVLDLIIPAKSSLSLVDKFLGNLSMCVFWVESDINSYMASTFKSTIRSDSAEKQSFIDLFVRKLINRNSLLASNQTLANNSGLNTTRDSIGSSSIRSLNGDDNSFNNSMVAAASKIKLSKEDCTKLMRQSLKCCHFKMELPDRKKEVYNTFFIYYLQKNCIKSHIWSKNPKNQKL